MIYEITQDVPVLVGQGAVKEVGKKLREDYGVTKVALVYDMGVKNAGIADKVLEALTESGMPCVCYDKVERDAPDYTVDELGAVIRENGCDGIVAVGGGSTLDTAKGAGVVASNPGCIRDYMIQRPARLAGTDTAAGFASASKHKQTVPLVTIPTTSGTGSEIRLTGVIHDTELHKKDIVEYTPKFAVQDPELLVTMPPFITATTAFDAMAHANESMTSIVGQKKLRNTILGAGVTQTVFEWLPVAIAEPNNLVAREKLAVASTLAALCSLDGLAHVGHNTADSFNYNFNMAHGHACALTLPPTIELAAPYAADSVRHIAIAQGIVLSGDETPQVLGRMVADKYRELARAVGIPSMKDQGITREQMVETQVIEDIFLNQNAMNKFPSGTGITREEAKWLLLEIYDRY